MVAMWLFPFLAKHLLRNLVSRPLRAIVLCILLCTILHEICTPISANGRFLVLFFFARKKSCHRHVNGFGDLPFISLVSNRARSLKKYFLSINNLGKKERHSLTWKLARELVAHAHAHLYRILNKYKAGVFRCIIRELVVFFSEGKCYEKLERIPNIGRVCEIADKHVTFLIQELFWSVSAWS